MYLLGYTNAAIGTSGNLASQVTCHTGRSGCNLLPECSQLAQAAKAGKP